MSCHFALYLCLFFPNGCLCCFHVVDYVVDVDVHVDLYVDFYGDSDNDVDNMLIIKLWLIVQIVVLVTEIVSIVAVIFLLLTLVTFAEIVVILMLFINNRSMLGNIYLMYGACIRINNTFFKFSCGIFNHKFHTSLPQTSRHSVSNPKPNESFLGYSSTVNCSTFRTTVVLSSSFGTITSAALRHIKDGRLAAHGYMFLVTLFYQCLRRLYCIWVWL